MGALRKEGFQIGTWAFLQMVEVLRQINPKTLRPAAAPAGHAARQGVVAPAAPRARHQRVVNAQQKILQKIVLLRRRHLQDLLQDQERSDLLHHEHGSDCFSDQIWEDMCMTFPMLCRRHLRDLLQDSERSDLLYHEHVSEHGTCIADFSRQRVTKETLKLLVDLAEKVGLVKSPRRQPDSAARGTVRRWLNNSQSRTAAFVLACSRCAACLKPGRSADP